jgi:hypothetical protein
VHLGLNGLLDTLPDMVVSGINLGANLGDDVLYSGTVAAALEGVSSIARRSPSRCCRAAGQSADRHAFRPPAGQSQGSTCRRAPYSTSTFPTCRWSTSVASS